MDSETGYIVTWSTHCPSQLGLNDKVLFESQGRAGKQKTVELEDIKFHQCVRLARFENDRTISFIPPDGSFDLMTYRLSQVSREWRSSQEHNLYGDSYVDHNINLRN